MDRPLHVSSGGAVTVSDSIPEVRNPSEIQVGEVFRNLFQHPNVYIVRRWNWKSALLSSLVRASLFFAVNISCGHAAALTAMMREFCIRAAASGFYGGFIESFRSARPRWASSLIVLVALPLLNHSAEFLIHWQLGTPNLKAGMLASLCFTAISTSFSLFAMRRDAFITGQNRKSLMSDFRMLPGLLLDFCRTILCFPFMKMRFLRGLWMGGKSRNAQPA